jgi:hypothetical protein
VAVLPEPATRAGSCFLRPPGAISALGARRTGASGVQAAPAVTFGPVETLAGPRSVEGFSPCGVFVGRLGCWHHQRGRHPAARLLGGGGQWRPESSRTCAGNHIGLVALCIALTGTAYAATLPRNSVGRAQLKMNAVTSPKVKRFSLLASDFARGQLPAGRAGATGLVVLKARGARSGRRAIRDNPGRRAPTLVRRCSQVLRSRPIR